MVTEMQRDQLLLRAFKGDALDCLESESSVLTRAMKLMDALSGS